jgi:hypothetical protein
MVSSIDLFASQQTQRARALFNLLACSHLILGNWDCLVQGKTDDAAIVLDQVLISSYLSY